MKLKNKFKLLIPFSLLAATTIPILLTSCSTVSQYIMPVTIGNGLESGSIFKNVNDYLTDVTFPEKNNVTLTNDFVFKTDTSGNTNNYGLVVKNTQVDDLKTKIGPQWMDLKEQGQYSWIETKDFETPKADGLKSYQVLNDWQNYVSYLQTSFATTIANNLEYMITYIMHFLLSSHNLNNPNNYQLIWESLNPKSLNNDFFEFACAYANLLNEGNTGVRFGISNINFNLQGENYLSNTFSGPLALKSNEPNDPYSLINGTSNQQKYGIFYTDEEQKDQAKKATDIKAYRPVCFLINNLDIDYNFYNSKNNLNSIFYRDWAMFDQQKVQNAIGDHWNGITNNEGEHPKVTTLNWKTQIYNNSQNNINQDQINDISIRDPEGNVNNLLENAKTGSFVVIANFVPGKVYYPEDQTANEDQYYYMPQFSEILGIYPAFMLNDKNAWIQDNENDLNGWIDVNYLSSHLKNIFEVLSQNNQTITNLQQKEPEIFNFIKEFCNNYLVPNTFIKPIN